jgi:hypothetical protein
MAARIDEETTDDAVFASYTSRPGGSPVGLDDALDLSLIDFRIVRGGATDSWRFAVYSVHSPECRGEGDTLVEALRTARHEVNRMRDLRLAVVVDEMLSTR